MYENRKYLCEQAKSSKPYGLKLSKSCQRKIFPLTGITNIAEPISGFLERALLSSCFFTTVYGLCQKRWVILLSPGLSYNSPPAAHFFWIFVFYAPPPRKTAFVRDLNRVCFPSLTTWFYGMRSNPTKRTEAHHHHFRFHPPFCANPAAHSLRRNTGSTQQCISSTAFWKMSEHCFHVCISLVIVFTFWAAKGLAWLCTRYMTNFRLCKSGRIVLSTANNGIGSNFVWFWIPVFWDGGDRGKYILWTFSLVWFTFKFFDCWIWFAVP